MNGKSKTHFGAFWEPVREMAGFPKRRKTPAKDHDGFSE